MTSRRTNNVYFSVENSMAAGHYVSNHTMLKIKVELAHPLITPERVAAKEPIPTTPEVRMLNVLKF